jgi:hypothetical protein
MTQIIHPYRGWLAWSHGDASAISLLMGLPAKD